MNPSRLCYIYQLTVLLRGRFPDWKVPGRTFPFFTYNLKFSVYVVPIRATSKRIGRQCRLTAQFPITGSCNKGLHTLAVYFHSLFPSAQLDASRSISNSLVGLDTICYPRLLCSIFLDRSRIKHRKLYVGHHHADMSIGKRFPERGRLDRRHMYSPDSTCQWRLFITNFNLTVP